MPRVSRDALVDEILSHLGSRSENTQFDSEARSKQDREFAAIDVHLRRLPGERPNWDVSIDGAEPSELEEIRRTLSRFELADDDEDAVGEN